MKLHPGGSEVSKLTAREYNDLLSYKQKARDILGEDADIFAVRKLAVELRDQ